jgi:cytoskeletal protein RodZ
MPKREPDPEPLDEVLAEPEVSPVGERLRVAREGKGLSLEDVAAQTRIPQRHLASIETGDWDNLPAPTYTIGFAKSYAAIVGLDRTEIGNDLREEMGGQRFASNTGDIFEPADPRRTMPRSLVLGAILTVVVLIALMSWLSNRSLDQDNEAPGTNASAPTTAVAPASQPVTPAPASVTAQGQVVISATAPAWIQVTDQGRKLFQGELQPGQTYSVPPGATAPVLKAGKPEALTVTVGSTTAPPVGPPGKVSIVSLLPADLMKGPQATAPATRQQPTSRRQTAVLPPPVPVETPTPTTNTAE